MKIAHIFVTPGAYAKGAIANAGGEIAQEGGQWKTGNGW